MAEELFRSADLLVRRVAGNGAGYVGGHGAACCVVTFDSFTDVRTLDRPGFGEAFLAASGLDAVHVLSRENDWYHYPEMAEAMACVAAVTRCYGRVVAYGSSMGAYAAIRFAELAGATAILALSPQYSIDPSVVPWERRWRQIGKHFNGRWERALPFPSVEQAIIVHDPENLDRRHIERIAARLRFEAIPIGFGGHPVTGFLAEIGLLKELVLDVCHDRFDGQEFLRRALKLREKSPQCWINRAECLPDRQRRQRLAYIREACRLAPEQAWVINSLAVELRFAGQYQEALALHRRALELAPGHPPLLLNYSIALERSGDIAAALAVMEALDVSTGATPIYQPRLNKLRKRLGIQVKSTAAGAGMKAVLRRLVTRRARNCA